MIIRSTIAFAPGALPLAFMFWTERVLDADCTFDIFVLCAIYEKARMYPVQERERERERERVRESERDMEIKGS